MTEAHTTTDQPSGGDLRTEQPSEELARLRARVEELEDQWRRALADLDNVRKRNTRDAQRGAADERARTVRQWLPIVDNLELALEHSDADASTVKSGVEAVLTMAVDLLARLGYPRREDLGMKFDPARHEAVSVVPTGEAPEGTVLHVVRPGYGDDDRQLRPAAVVVASRPD